MVLDLDNKLSGDVFPYFKEFTQDVNRDYIMRMADIYTFPKTILDALVSHQYGMSCAHE